MKYYFEKILQILDSNGVTNWYSDDEDIVYTFSEYSAGKTFGVYGASDGVIRNSCIYDRTVPENKQEYIQEYLEKINLDLKQGSFILNKSRGYVVFFNDYSINQDIEGDCFAQFCKQSNDVFCRYCENISKKSKGRIHQQNNFTSK